MDVIVLFDQTCSLCRSLAGLMEKRSSQTLKFCSWRDFKSCPPKELLGAYLVAESELGLWDGSVLHTGEAAWKLLMEKHPDLQSLLWLAEKLGLSVQQVGKVAQFTGHAARRLCLGCPSEVQRRRK